MGAAACCRRLMQRRAVLRHLGGWSAGMTTFTKLLAGFLAVSLVGAAGLAFGQGRGRGGGVARGGGMHASPARAGAVHAAPMRSAAIRPGSARAGASSRVVVRTGAGRAAVVRRASPVAARGVVRTTGAARRTSSRPVAFRVRRDRFGRLHREAFFPFVGPFLGVGYPGFFDEPGFTYPDDSGYAANGDSGGGGDAYASAAPDTVAGVAASGAAVDNTLSGTSGLILARTDGGIVMPEAFTITGDRVVYVTHEGARLSFPASELDRETTKKMNEANGNSIGF